MKHPDPFYSSAAWRAARRQALIRAGFACEWCHADVSAFKASRVDHIRTRKSAPELSLVQSNLRVLCASCDNRRHAEKMQGVAGHELRAVSADGRPTSSAHHWNRPR